MWHRRHHHWQVPLSFALTPTYLTSTDVKSSPERSLPFEGSDEVFIRSHEIDRVGTRVYLWVEWRDTNRRVRHTTRYDEYIVQDTAPEMLYAYWQSKGGRCNATRLNLFHVYAILDESPKKYLIQWVGYDESEATWERFRKVSRICSEAVCKWKAEKN